MSAMATATLECISSLRMADYSSRGANRGLAPANFRYPMASRWIGKGGCTWPTGRTAASNSSHPTARSFPSGPMSRMWPGTTAPTADAPGGRVSVFDRHGQLRSRWGGGQNPCAPGDFFAPHGICVDSHGDIYVAEVTMSAGGNRGLVPPTCHTLQKFVRRKTEP